MADRPGRELMAAVSAALSDSEGRTLREVHTAVGIGAPTTVASCLRVLCAEGRARYMKDLMAAVSISQVPDLTRSLDINLNERVPLRRCSKALSVAKPDIALVRDQRGATVGRSIFRSAVPFQIGMVLDGEVTFVLFVPMASLCGVHPATFENRKIGLGLGLAPT